MTKIVGVDFSGAATNNNTWVTTGTLQNGALVLEACERLAREETDAHNILKERLRKLHTNADAVVALDFPFGIPEVVFPKIFDDRGLSKPGNSMPAIWKATNDLGDLTSFLNSLRRRLLDGDLKEYKKCKRKGDEFFKECLSPLNPAQPNMIPMTFRGMQLLHYLWALKGSNFRVPPLNIPERTGPQLLEVMPGAVLNAFCLPHKTYKRGFDALKERQKILANLSTRSSVPLPNLHKFRDHCMFSDDALDSIVAAVAAAMWADREKRSRFRRPEDCPNPSIIQAAQLEGWIYAPRKTVAAN